MAAEIPDGDRQNCTSDRSTIHHNPSMATYGEIIAPLNSVKRAASANHLGEGVCLKP
ncbi:hypothetical protein H6F74_05040 [Trichocoleus sp. FACHB-90]|uniref:hypothetical protein n=1 Tax=Cyanophyceae TaxID=3028117 RepID=UPI0016857D5B|nr:hypothetical protein [Trichocoleus sp. FACHB-90]MBD1925650.1 hypothetical protein [Trichocoleus sp. FACHB-90]